MVGTSRSVLLDSNVVIYTSLPNFEELREWLRYCKAFVSEITILEVLGYHRLTKGDTIYFEDFFSASSVVKINSEQIRATIELRQKKSMSLGDSIIAATALNQNLPLVTANTKYFDHIRDLKLLRLPEHS